MVKLFYKIMFIIFIVSPSLLSAVEYPLSVACGDVQADETVIWVRGNFPASVTIEYANNKLFNSSKKINDLTITEPTDYTGKIMLKGLPSSQTIFYRASRASCI